MNKKLICIYVLAAISVTAFYYGNMVGKAISGTYVNVGSAEFRNNYIDMREVADFSATETEMRIVLNDGNEYVWER